MIVEIETEELNMVSRSGRGLGHDNSGDGAAAMTCQQWWQGPGYDAAPPHSAARLPGARHESQLHGIVDGGGSASKEEIMQILGTVAPVSGTSFGRPEHQQPQPSSSSVPHMMPEYLLQHTQDLGQSVVGACAQYSYADPYAGVVAAYGPQAMVHPPPRLLGMQLPLEMTEEPVYVNAKQYHGILRRRQSRAKAELEKKIIKDRKPYLHESRHQHAIRRARGCGGRFLNTKKTDAQEETLPSDCTGHPETEAAMMQSKHRDDTNCVDQQHYYSGFQLSAQHSQPGEGLDEGDYSDIQ